jgi:hypothetical protein
MDGDLSNSHFKTLLRVLARNAKIFLQFKNKFSHKTFSNPAHGEVYEILLNFWEDNNRLPSRLELKTEILSLFDQPDSLDTGEVEEICALLKFIYSKDDDEACKPSDPHVEQYAKKIGKRALQLQHLSEIKTNLRTVDLDDVPVFLRNMQEKSVALKNIDNDPRVCLTFKDGWDVDNPLIVKSCGIPVFDYFMSGGVASGELYMLFAPLGVGKTTVAVQLWVEAAKQCAAEELRSDWDGRRGVTFYVSYEPPLTPELNHRLLMNAAHVSRESLQSMGFGGLANLSNDPDNPKPYELERFQLEIENGLFKPERKRVEDVIGTLNNHTCCLDFSGANKAEVGAGLGGVAEIVERIKAELEVREKKTNKQHYVKNIMVDYLAALVNNHSKTPEVVKSKRTETQIYLDQVYLMGRDLAKGFNCHMWIMHQLDSKANQQENPTARLSHADSKGCKMSAENCDFAFVIGKLQNQIGQLVCTKHRRSAPHSPRLVHIDGEFNRIQEAGNHTIVNNKIVLKELAETVSLEEEIAGILADHSESENF